MTETITKRAARTRSTRTRGWVHAIDSTGEFSADDVAELATKTVGDTITLSTEQIDEIYPSTVLDPTMDGRHAIEEADITSGVAEESMGVLLYVDIVKGTFTGDGAEFVVGATHHPRDIYGTRGTPLREAIDLLESDNFDPYDINEACADLLREKGIEYGDSLEHIRRGDSYWITTYRGGVEAAEKALTAAGRNTWFPGSCCHGEQYVAIAARDLIDTVSGWTWDTYELVARPFALATGRKLHPDDPDWKELASRPHDRDV
jgi:hypothetical protein